MAAIQVTPQILREASNELGNISSEMKTITADMSMLVEELKASWSDSTGELFVSRFENEVGTKFSEYYNAIQAFSDFIRGASEKYERASASIESSVNTSA